MKVIFWCSDKARERVLAREFMRGVKSAGDEGEIKTRIEARPDGDVAIVCGVKSREIWRMLRSAGITVVLLDQGYFKETKYHRVAINDHHPTRYLETARHTQDRWDGFGVAVRPWRRDGSHIVIAGGSEKYHKFYDLPHPTEYYESLAKA